MPPAEEMDDAPQPGRVTLVPPRAQTAIAPLSELIEQLGAGIDRFDERFAREFSKALHAEAAHVRIPAVDRLGLEDVVVTLHMDRRLRLVVTGNLPAVCGAVSIRWDEVDFPSLPVALSRAPVADPYLFATLDLSVRGAKGVLSGAVSPFPAGQTVTVRALATIGDRTEYRVSALGLDRSVAPELLDLG